MHLHHSLAADSSGTNACREDSTKCSRMVVSVTDVSSHCYLQEYDSASFDTSKIRGNSWQLLGWLMAELHECSERHCSTYAVAGAQQMLSMAVHRIAMLAYQDFHLKGRLTLTKATSLRVMPLPWQPKAMLAYQKFHPKGRLTLTKAISLRVLKPKGKSLPIRNSARKADSP